VSFFADLKVDEYFMLSARAYLLESGIR